MVGERDSAPQRDLQPTRSEPASARARPAPEDARRPSAPTRSMVARLTAEVKRLEAELAAAKSEAEALAARADEDALTGIANRRGFDRELSRTLSYVARYGATAALVMIDLDGFKGINDRRGHAAGDDVLRGVASALAGQVRASDHVARLGGDEFALILWNIAPRDVERKARQIEDLISALPAGAGELGASAGVTHIEGGDSAVAVLARADRAMYARKAARGAGR